MRSHRLLWLPALAVGASSACYTAAFDDNAGGVFACVADSDCPSGQLCAAEVCVPDEGPELRFTGPEPLSRFDFGGDVEITLNILGSGIELDEPGPAHVEGKGYLEIRVDGVVAGDTVKSGDLANGVQPTVLMTAPTAGLHRIEVQAFRVDGLPYVNSDATTTNMIWVDDGAPHVGLSQPWPGSRHKLDEPLDVEVVALNFQFIQVDFASGPVVEDEGHTHVYINRDLPSCLPGCLFNYAVGGSLKPGTSDPAAVVSGPLDIEGSLMETPEPGTITLSATLNYTEHYPIPATSENGPEWDDPAIYDQIRVDTIEVELVE